MVNRQQIIELEAINYFITEHQEGLLRLVGKAFRLAMWKYSVAGSKGMKRGMDILVALVMLLMLSPLFFTVALLIRIESKAPILFSQTRIGLGGKPFRFWKFRSMRTDAELIQSQLSSKFMSDGVRFKLKKDPRITKVGAVIRKYSIDELPQLWNVLIGDMSLVGPRPALPQEVEAYTLADKQRLTVMPGITCIWQVSGRSEIPFKQQVKLDVQYRWTQSFAEDIRLLFLTVPAVLLGKGAY